MLKFSCLVFLVAQAAPPETCLEDGSCSDGVPEVSAVQVELEGKISTKIRDWLQEKYLEKYLLSMYQNETKGCSLKDFNKEKCDMTANSAVAHASNDETLNTMNIALPGPHPTRKF